MNKIEKDLTDLAIEFQSRADDFEFSQTPRSIPDAQSNGKHLAYTHSAKRICEILKHHGINVSKT